jgi:hypothetical protein
MILFRTFHCLNSSNEIREVFFAKQTDPPIIAAGYYRRFGDGHAQQKSKRGDFDIPLRCIICSPN